MSQTIYQGPSTLNNAPIRAVLTYGSENTKLTDRLDAEVLQLWILTDAVPPTTAIKTGQDEAICGSCPLRAWRGGEKVTRLCYVNQMTATAVWRGSNGNKVITPAQAVRTSRAHLLRLGAYGDPAALPYDLVSDLVSAARGAGIRRLAGYTAQWKTADIRFRRLLMASCQGYHDELLAQLMGWRTFSAVLPDTPLAPDTIFCPATAEGGDKTVCERCGLCDGAKLGGDMRKSIRAVVHGPQKEFKFLQFAALLAANNPSEVIQ